MTAISEEGKAHWFKTYDTLIAVVVTFLGFLARLWAAHGIFLNPDEALHFRLANQPSLLLAYKASLTASHPPLLTVVLYYWRALGTSELWLRMPSVVASVVFCWMFYKWLARAAGPIAGFLGPLFGGFLPPRDLSISPVARLPGQRSLLSRRRLRERFRRQNGGVHSLSLWRDVFPLLRLFFRSRSRDLRAHKFFFQPFIPPVRGLGRGANRRNRAGNFFLQESHLETRTRPDSNGPSGLDERRLSSALLLRFNPR